MGERDGWTMRLKRFKKGAGEQTSNKSANVGKLIHLRKGGENEGNRCLCRNLYTRVKKLERGEGKKQCSRGADRTMKVKRNYLFLTIKKTKHSCSGEAKGKNFDASPFETSTTGARNASCARGYGRYIGRVKENRKLSEHSEAHKTGIGPNQAEELKKRGNAGRVRDKELIRCEYIQRKQTFYGTGEVAPNSSA